jgi:endo-alpha-1,4-polygalactosaminidase (GH114 family)
MSALSIRHMNFTLQRMEHVRAQQDEAWFASLPEAEKTERTRYWHVYRKAKRGNKWVFVCEYFGTKAMAARFWVKNFQGKKTYRLRHLLRY